MIPADIRFVDIVLVVILSISLYTDIKQRKILNAVVLPAMLAGLIYYTVGGGLQGIAFSLKGIGAGFALLMLPFLLGGFGAGDVKLLCAIGALKGPGFLVTSFIWTAICGGIISVLILLYRHQLWSTVKRVVTSCYLLISTRFNLNVLKNLDNSEYHEAFPYGIAIVAGTVAAYMVR